MNSTLKIKNIIVYPNTTSADRPVRLGKVLLIPVPSESFQGVLQPCFELYNSQPSEDDFHSSPKNKNHTYLHKRNSDLAKKKNQNWLTPDSMKKKLETVIFIYHYRK